MTTTKLDLLFRMKREVEAVITALDALFNNDGNIYDAVVAAIERNKNDLYSVESAIKTVMKEEGQ
jgi:hypothetical protein